MIDEQNARIAQHKATTPEPVLTDWPFQKEIDLLVASGFAVLDERQTMRWKEDVWSTPARPDRPRTYHRCYTWTKEGQQACFRSQHTTPMSWADSVHFKRVRHCVVCGRDCYRKKVWAHDGGFRCVCMECGGKGHGLKDLPERA